MATRTINRPLLAVALLFWLANALLHLEFSNWISTPTSTPFGEMRPRDVATEMGLLVSLAIAILLALRVPASPQRLAWVGALMVWLGLAAAARQLLVTTDIELIHYLQYALITALIAAALDPKRETWPLISILVLSLLLSVVDETNQYLYLTASYGSYLDFNDFCLNQLGSLLGLLLYYGFLWVPRSASEVRPLLPVLTALLAVTLLALMLASFTGLVAVSPPHAVDPGGLSLIDGQWTLFLQREPGLFASWQNSFGGGRYYVLGPLQGSTLLLLSFLAVAFFHRWLRERSHS